MPTLEEAVSGLRAAVASQAYAEARRLIPVYCELLERDFRRQPPSSPEARRIAEAARDLYRSLARAVLADRANCAEELRQLARVSTYLQPARPSPHACDFEG